MKKLILLVIAVICFSLFSQAATLTFLTVHPGTGTGYIKSTQSISWTATMDAATGYFAMKFISANPADVTFNGNDVAGQFTYFLNGQKFIINGIISRPAKTGNTDDAYYFFETTVLGGTTSTGKAWLFVIPGRESVITTSPTTTSSDPVDKALNSLLTTQNSYADPVITSNGAGASAQITLVENTTIVTTNTATVYPTSSKTFSITGGVDASKFSIDPVSGVLSFVSSPDYENPTDAGLNNVYDVQITVTDSQGTSDTQAIAVTITNTNDNAPVITSNGGGISATINVTAGTTIVTTNTATDADYGDVLTYSISGADASLFTIDPSSGVLVLKSAAVVGTDKVVVLTVTDALGHTDTQTLTIHVTATDTTAPTLVITASDPILSMGEVTTIYFKFSELVQGFTFSDVNLGGTGGILGSITQSGSDPTLYIASYTQSGSNLTPYIQVANNTYTDMNNNNGTGNILNMNADITAPTVAVSFASPDIAYGETDIVTFTFSENPGNSFSMSDVTVSNAILSNLTQTGTPTIWKATIQQQSAVAAPVVTVQNNSYTDLAGNLGSSGTATIPVVPPSIDLANTPTSDTGISSIDNITTNRNPIVTGYVDAGTSTVTVQVQYYVGSTLTTFSYQNVPVTNQQFNVNLASAIPSGNSTPISPLPQGYVTLVVTTPTSATASSQFLIDLTTPTAPTANNLTTYDQSPTLTGTATVADGEVLTVNVNGVTYTNGDGNLALNGTNWTLNIPFANRIPASTYTITAKTTDLAGNFSTGTGTLTINASTVTIDLRNDPIDDTGTLSTDNITTNRKPILTGTASGSDATVKITVISGGVSYIYNSVAVSSNTFTLDLSAITPSSIVPTGSFPSAGLASGTVQLTVEGNTSGAVGANNFVIDITAPTTPTVNSQTTWDTTPTITGSATVGAGDILRVTINGVTYTNGDGNLIYSAGSWSLTIPAGNALSVASYPTTVTVTDASGNVATGNGTTTIAVATVSGDLANTAGSDTGTSSTDNFTSNRKPVITGTASDDAVVTVTLTLGGTTYTYNNVSVSGGNWSLDLSTASTTSGAAFPGTGLTTGTWGINVTGNTTGSSGSNTFVEDYTAPTTPTVNFLTTFDTTPTITGTATVNEGDIFTVTVNGVTYTNGDGQLSYSAGYWSLVIPQGNALPIDTYTVLAVVTDVAGNPSTSTTSNQLVINANVSDLQTYDIICSPTFTTASISWSNGSKSSRVVFMKEGTGAITNPTNNISYSSSSNWNSKGSQLASSGYYCIYDGSSSNGSVTVTNLYPGRIYTIQAFEYSGSAGNETYLTNISGNNNPTTVVPWPTTTFTNSVGVSTAEAWNNPGRWDHNTVPDADLHQAVLIYIDGNCEVQNDAACYNLTIKAAHSGITPKLTINPGKTLHVLGGALNGELTNLGGASALLIKSSPSYSNGSLIFHNIASHPVLASVQMYSKAFTDSKFHWQYFGIPVKSQTVGTTFGAYPERVRKYDESNADPNNIGLWYPAGSTSTLPSNTVMVPVDGYEVTQPASKIFTFVGELNNQDINRRLQYTVGANWAGQNILANPFTCAIDISQMTFGDDTEATIYQYNTGSLSEWQSNGGSSTPGSNPGTYIAATPRTAGNLGIPDQIPSMQGFLVKALSNSVNATFSLEYNKTVANTKQQRTKAVNNTATICTSIDVIGTVNSDKVWIFSEPTCTRNFDNGWDGRKFLGATTQLCAMEPDGNYQIDAINDINDTYLGFLPGTGTRFKLLFTHQNIELKYNQIFLNDLETGTKVDVTANNSEYSFTAVSGSPLTKRFKITTQSDIVNNVVDKNHIEKLSVYESKNEVFVHNRTGVKGKMYVYSTTGVIVASYEIGADEFYAFKPQLPTGMYITKTVVGSEKLSLPIVIK